MRTQAGAEIPVTLVAKTPADGTLSLTDPVPPALRPYQVPRTREMVVPFEDFTPGVGSVYRLDSIWVTNISAADAWWSASISLAGTLRSALARAPYTQHFAWGRLLPAGESESIATGGIVVAGPPGNVLNAPTNNTYIPGPGGQALFSGAWPGWNGNISVDPLYNDGVPAAIVIGMNGVVLL